MEELLNPNMSLQIAQMQQILQMQQMAIMTQFALRSAGGGGGAVGIIPAAGGAPMLAAGISAAGMLSPMVGGGMIPGFGAAASGIPVSASGQGAQALPQSTTEEVKEEKVDDNKLKLSEWFGDSKIIEDDEYNTLIDFFPNKGESVKEMVRIFRASEDGFDAYSFHQKCDDVGCATLVIIKSG
eukprot:284893_1